MWGAISLGVLSGVVIAIAGTLLYVLLNEMRPREAMLGRIPGRSGFYKLHRSKDARPIPGMVLYMVQGSVLFFNADYVRSRIQSIADQAPPGTKWLVLDASAIARIDSTGAVMFRELHGALVEKGLSLSFAELHADPRDTLTRASVLEPQRTDMVFDDLEDACRAFEVRTP
jgi:SulP family sulfate permease